MRKSTIKRLAEWYVRRAGMIGFLYCLIPVLLWFGGVFLLVPFRGVYVLRLILSVVVGGATGAIVNRFAVSTWVAKHRSPQGPAGVLDGLMIGAATGFGATLLPPLTSLIATNHLEQAKSFIIIAWLVAVANGALIGAALGAIGRKHLDRGQEGEGGRGE